LDTALIVFALGTAASFAPMYWLASRLMGRRGKPVKADARLPLVGGDPAGRGEFMDLLRQEAANRAVAVLRDALIEARLAVHEAVGGGLVLSAPTRQSLDETRRLVDSLFPSDLREAFGRGLETLVSATSESIGSATATTAAAIAAFERALDNGPSRSARARSRIGFWRSIRDRGRGWIGAGDVGVAA
jgi:hypothetical protein